MTFIIDVNGVLNVSAAHESSRMKNSILIIKSGTLADEEIKKIVKDIEHYKAEDEEFRKKVKAMLSFKDYVYNMREASERNYMLEASVKKMLSYTSEERMSMLCLEVFKITVQAMVDHDPSVLCRTIVHGNLFALHVAAVHGHIEVLSLLLDRSVNPDIVNRHKKTPLMLAAMAGNISCVERPIQVGANILKFDSLHGRTCLYYAAYYGHLDYLQAILSVAHSSHIAFSWGFARFVNIRDGSGTTPLHLAARQGSIDCIHILLVNGALISASTCGYGSSCSYPGSTPLHLAARGGSLDCIRELLAWGGDILQTDLISNQYNLTVKETGSALYILPLSLLKIIMDIKEQVELLRKQAKRVELFVEPRGIQRRDELFLMIASYNDKNKKTTGLTNFNKMKQILISIGVRSPLDFEGEISKLRLKQRSRKRKINSGLVCAT